MIIEGLSLILSTLAMGFACFALIEVKAMQRSTHRITMYDPSKQEFSTLTDEQKEEMQEKVYDNF